jgi:hypothetical protein
VCVCLSILYADTFCIGMFRFSSLFLWQKKLTFLLGGSSEFGELADCEKKKNVSVSGAPYHTQLCVHRTTMLV